MDDKIIIVVISVQHSITYATVQSNDKDPITTENAKKTDKPPQ